MLRRWVGDTREADAPTPTATESAFAVALWALAMCFSLTADLVAGTVVTGFGVDAFRHADGPRQKTLAAVPAVLGPHLLVEALVW